MADIIGLIKESYKISDKKFARSFRKAAFTAMTKVADDFGAYNSPNGGPKKYEPRPHQRVGRGGASVSKEKYDLGPKHKKVDFADEPVSRSLSTRYSPDRVGVQAQRLDDGVFQDPITNKVYDWNEGFKTDDGEEIAGGSVALQTDIYYRR